MNGCKVTLLCLLLLFLSTVAHAKIVFGFEPDGVEGIYVMDDDGSNQTLLTEDEELQPIPEAWSPDGKHILFQRAIRDIGGHVLFLMNRDGTNVRQLTPDDDSYIGKCSFSPDGKFIVYDGSVLRNNKEKYVVKVLNIKTGKINVISDLSVTFCDWSPDGKQIVFARPIAVGGGNGTLWIMDADGRTPRELIPDPGGPQADNFSIHRGKARWSPDGQKIVFEEREHKWEFVPNVGNALVFKAFRYMICDRDGGNIEQLHIPEDYEPVSIDWMDDGESIVFSAYADVPLNELIGGQIELPSAGHIYKYHRQTREITRLTDQPGRYQTLDWIDDDVLSVSPVGKKK